MTIPNEYQVDHLFLLIGENPLPNYVAAKTLLREGGKPYLVYTTHTQKAVERLQEVLEIPEEERQKLTVPLENYESNAHEIRQRIHEKIIEIWKEEGKQKEPKLQFGLNYTGGTKAMAVHSYKAFLEPPQYLKFEHPVVFSYLDSRSLTMKFEINQQPDSRKIPKHEIGDVTGKLLFNLHGLLWYPNKQPFKEPNLVEASSKLLNLYLDNENRTSFDQHWIDWCNDKLNPQTRDKNKYGKYINWKDEQSLESVILDLSEAPNQIKEILTQDLQLNDNYLHFKDVKQLGNFQKYYHLCEWLNCSWIEHYVLSQIQKISIEPPIDGSAMSFNIIEQPNDEWEKFQFDVAFRRSYQLFAISCTTSRATDRCKEKLFEAYIRAKQLGGDEARVALVCFHQYPKNILSSFNSLIKDQKVAVFGHKDLKRGLKSSIETWLKNLDKRGQ